MISNRCHYALQAMLELSLRHRQGPATIGQIADAQAIPARFLACAEARRALGRDVYPLDEPFLGALEAGMPPSGGIALGVDRLVMLLCGAESIDEVRSFCPLR